MPVVHFDDFDVVAGRSAPGGDFQQLESQVHADAHVRRKDHADIGAAGQQQLFSASLKPVVPTTRFTPVRGRPPDAPACLRGG